MKVNNFLISSEIGNQISIAKIKVPNLGEGTAYISSPHLIDHNFIKKNIKFEPPVNPNVKFHIDDGLLCFGFFNMHFDIGYVEGSNLDFFNDLMQTIKIIFIIA